MDVHLERGQEYLIAVHLVDYVSPFPHPPSKKLKTQLWYGLQSAVQLARPAFTDNVARRRSRYATYVTLWSTVSVLTVFLFWLLSSQNLYEKKTIRLFAILWTWAALSNLCRYYPLFDSSIVATQLALYLIDFCLWQTACFGITATLLIFGYRLQYGWLGVGFVVATLGALLNSYVGGDIVLSVATLIQQLVLIILIISSWKRLKGPQWVIVMGISSSVLLSALFAVFEFTQTKYNFYLLLAFLVYITLRLQEVLAEVVQVTQEKGELLATQNQRLEQQAEA